jgi:hypothetical protein
MSIRRLLIPALSVIVLACASLAADAQTGPVGAGQKGQGGPKGGVGATQGLTPDRAVSLLQAKGAQTKVSTAENQNAKFTMVQAKLQTNDFMYDFVVVFVTYNNGNQSWYLSANLNPKSANLSAAQLQGLLKENFVMSGDNFFMIDPQTGAVMMQSGRYSVSIGDQIFQRSVDIYMNDIKATANLWYTAP